MPIGWIIWYRYHHFKGTRKQPLNRCPACGLVGFERWVEERICHLREDDGDPGWHSCSLKLTWQFGTWKIGLNAPKGKDRIPSIHFSGAMLVSGRVSLPNMVERQMFRVYLFSLATFSVGACQYLCRPKARKGKVQSEGVDAFKLICYDAEDLCWNVQMENFAVAK